MMAEDLKSCVKEAEITGDKAVIEPVRNWADKMSTGRAAMEMHLL